MRKLLLSVGLISSFLTIGSTAFAAPCGSVAGNLVNNCGFETGSFTQWTLGGQLSGLQGGAYYGIQSFPVNSGNFSAYIGTDTTIAVSPTTLSQQVTGASGSFYLISFYLDQDAGIAGSSSQPITYRVTFGGTLLTSVVNAPATAGFVQQSFTIPDYVVNPTLSFSFENYPDYFFLDDVVVQKLGAVPEPSSLPLGLLGAALLLVAHFNRRKIFNR